MYYFFGGQKFKMHVSYNEWSFANSIISRVEDKELENSLEQTHKFIKILAKMDYVEEKDVKWAFGVLQTNSIGLPTGRALYPIVSIMNHSCAPNMTALTIPGTV